MLYIVTFYSDITKLKYLIASSSIFNLKIKYIQYIWKTNSEKINYMKEYVNTLNDDDIICFIDAYDVICNSSYDDIYFKFLNIDCDLLISTELNCFPESYKSEMNNISDYYLNSGGYIGYKNAILDLLAFKNIKDVRHPESDQAYFYEYYFANYNNNRIKLDTESIIFQSMYLKSWNDLSVLNNKIFVNRKIIPCFVHFNGKSFLNGEYNYMDTLIEKMIS